MSEKVSDVVTIESTSDRQKEELRCLVRRYTKLDEKSEEGLAIAKQVYADTGYYLGPMTKEIPKFAMDSKYRKKSLKKLTGCLDRMNQEWSDADSKREFYTETKYSRNEDGLFEYIDTVTGAQIPTRVYEQRYLQYIKAHEINPVLRLFPGQEIVAREDKGMENDTPASSAVLKADENTTSLFVATLGIDISSSFIIDKYFFSSGARQAPLDIQRYRGEDMAFRAAVDSARADLWHRWGIAFDRVSADRAIQAGSGHSDKQLQPTIDVADHRSATRKRARERRRSLVLPNSDDILSIEASVENSSEDANDTTSSKSDSHQPRPKKCRSMSQKSNTAQKSRRESRRQSIVSQVDYSLIVTSEAEEKTAATNCRVPQSSRKSLFPRHSANGYARETSSLEIVEDKDSDLCQLCYSEKALVHMNRCDHAVCSSCWSRLSPSSGKTGISLRRVCPWDCEVVTNESEEKSL
ncbi:unnamed protein product [Peronospora farinosa]|uniref:RING-type domain-containing protein n=1 Tax=Peronospora farinosa TaxID=134698 RepID=A0AAV0U3U4_9STRA|nr:unnamed protein product [Peronospora farinosa]